MGSGLNLAGFYLEVNMHRLTEFWYDVILLRWRHVRLSLLLIKSVSTVPDP